MNSVIRTDNLKTRLGRREVLHGISFEIERGEFVSLLGPNGSGKTTLLRTLNGIIQPSTGRVWLGGRELAAYTHKEIARKIAYVPQGF